MKKEEIIRGFRATIDQFYNQSTKSYIDLCQSDFIGGVLQSALHIIPVNDYQDLKQYIYDQYGYDPGGVETGQRSLLEIWMERREKYAAN